MIGLVVPRHRHAFLLDKGLEGGIRSDDVTPNRVAGPGNPEEMRRVDGDGRVVVGHVVNVLANKLSEFEDAFIAGELSTLDDEKTDVIVPGVKLGLVIMEPLKHITVHIDNGRPVILQMYRIKKHLLRPAAVAIVEIVGFTLEDDVPTVVLTTNNNTLEGAVFVTFSSIWRFNTERLQTLLGKTWLSIAEDALDGCTGWT
jgi:hypothetical protein